MSPFLKFKTPWTTCCRQFHSPIDLKHTTAAVRPLSTPTTNSLTCVLSLTTLHRLRCLFKCYEIRKTVRYVVYLHILSTDDFGHYNVMCYVSSSGNLHLQKRKDLLSIPNNNPALLKRPFRCLDNFRIFTTIIITHFYSTILRC